MQDTQTTPFRHGFQQFSWLDMTWDIAKLISDIDAGALTPTADTLSREFIEGYATQVLGLDRSRPRPSPGSGTRSISLLMAVNLEEALALPAAALTDPVILLQTPREGKGLLRLDGFDVPSHVLADGQHRVAKAFYEDISALPMYLLSAQQSRKYLLA